MKRLLRKLFFWDEPAQGAFFGLTTFWVCSWLVFTWIYLLDHLGVLECLFNGQQLWGSICLIAVMMVLVFLPVIIRFSSLYGLCLKDTVFLRRHRYGILLASFWLLGIIFDAQGLLPMFSDIASTCLDWRRDASWGAQMGTMRPCLAVGNRHPLLRAYFHIRCFAVRGRH